MKLSQFPTDEALDVLCELTPHITNIITDAELINELRRKLDPNGKKKDNEFMALVADKINNIVPMILKKKKADIIGILAALNKKTAEEIAKQNLITTAKQIKEMLQDKELIDFFKSCTGMEGGE